MYFLIIQLSLDIFLINGAKTRFVTRNSIGLQKIYKSYLVMILLVSRFTGLDCARSFGTLRNTDFSFNVDRTRALANFRAPKKKNCANDARNGVA